MSYELTGKLKKITPYYPVEGKYKIRLDANESYLNINDVLSDKICNEIKKISLNRYPDSLATNLCNAFADLYEISPDNVTAGNGSDELISIICSCFFEKGDNVLTIEPDFSMYGFYSDLYELNVHSIEKNEDFEVDIDKVIDYCNSNNIKSVIFSNPCNPTSLGISKQDVIKLIKNVSCLVIVDEAYMDFWNQSIITIAEQFDNVIVLKTCSKALGIAAVRVGFAVAEKKITEMLRTVKSPYNTDSVSQAIGCAVLTEKNLLIKYREEIIRNKNILLESIVKMSEKYAVLEKVYESVTNFVFIKTKRAKEIQKGLMDKSVAVRCFDGYLRINTGSAEENGILLDSLDDVLKNLT